jgi:DNA invertase Pin-like site-specific DNA recombinase
VSTFEQQLAQWRSTVIGRKRSVDVDRVHQLHAAGQGASAKAKLLNISRTSVYRALNEKAS